MSNTEVPADETGEATENVTVVPAEQPEIHPTDDEKEDDDNG